MHIPDGIVPAQVCAGGYALAGGITWWVLRRIRSQTPSLAQGRAAVPQAALLAAVFFVASSIYLPVPPASVHLVLNGLMGAVLGWYAWPAILVGLFLQALLLGHGGITTLGVNGVLMGGPALVAAAVFQLSQLGRDRIPEPWRYGVAAFGAGAVGLGLSAMIFFGIILATLPENLDPVLERQALTGLMLAHLPLMVIEGIFTTLVVLFLRRVQPDFLAQSLGARGSSPPPPSIHRQQPGIGGKGDSGVQ